MNREEALRAIAAELREYAEDWERMLVSGEHTGAVCRGFADRITAILDAPPGPTEVTQ